MLLCKGLNLFIHLKIYFVVWVSDSYNKTACYKNCFAMNSIQKYNSLPFKWVNKIYQYFIQINILIKQMEERLTSTLFNCVRVYVFIKSSLFHLCTTIKLNSKDEYQH